jgi:hypothetical protein
MGRMKTGRMREATRKYVPTVLANIFFTSFVTKRIIKRQMIPSRFARTAKNLTVRSVYILTPFYRRFQQTDRAEAIVG